MKQTEFEEMVAINLALDGKYDVVVAEVAEVLEFELFIPRKKFDNGILTWIKITLAEIQGLTTSKLKDTVVKADLIKTELDNRKNKATHKFVKMIFEDLAGCIPQGDSGTITVSLVTKALDKKLTDLQTFFTNTAKLKRKDENFIPNKDFKKIRLEEDLSIILDGKGHSQKLSLHITNNINKTHLSYIATTDDFIKKEDTFTTDLKDWAVGIKAEMNDFINDKQGNHLVFQSLLSENYHLITDGDKLLDPIKTRFCNVIFNAIKGETTAAIIAEAGEKEVNNIRADAPFLRELFWKYYEPVKGKDTNIVITGPTKFGKWIKESIRENLIHKFVDAVNPSWTTNDKGIDAIGVFISDLKGKNYPLSKSRLTKNLQPILTRNKNGVGLDNLLFEELLKGLGTAPSEKEDNTAEIEAGTDTDKIAPQTLEQIWKKSIDKVYTKENMVKYYKSKVSSQIPDYELLKDYIKTISFEALPADYLVKDACYRSSFVPKPKKKEPEPEPLPTPTPTPRHNQIVTFKNLPYDQIEVVLLKDGKELDSIPFYFGAPNFTEIGHGKTKGNYEILVQYRPPLQNENDPRTKEQLTIFKQTAKKENQQEGFLCIFNFSNKPNGENIFEFNLPFTPRTAEIYTRLGNKLIEKVDIKSKANKGFFSFFTDENPLSAFHTIFEFFIRFDGAHAGDFYVTQPLIKSQIGSCSAKYTVDEIYEPVSFIFPYDPVAAWLTTDNNPEGAEVSGKTASTPSIPSNNKFKLGKGIGGGYLYLHISGKGNGQVMKVMSKKVYKQYSNHEWFVTLHNMNTPLANNVDFQDLRHEALRAMGDWVDDFLLELNAMILSKFDKDFKQSKDAASKIDFWNVLDAIIVAIPFAKKMSDATKVYIDLGAKLFRIIVEAVQYSKGQVQENTLEGMLKDFNTNTIQQFRALARTSTRDSQENIITHLIEENSEKNTGELSSIIYDETYNAIQPSPKDFVKTMKEQLDKM